MARVPPAARMPSTTKRDPTERPGLVEEDEAMDPMTAYTVARLRMAERHQEAARERLARFRSDDEQETSVWRRWTLRRLVGRITLAGAST
jgi:hypothetical protein